MPGIIGSTGCERSRAWIPDFSSTHSTTAFSGGLWYRPTTSTTFSTNSGSVDSLNPSMRWGFRSNLRQIRPTVDSDTPLRRAIEARDQCVASAGSSSRVAVTTSSTLSSRMDRGRPGPLRARQPVQPPPDEPAPPAGHVVPGGPQLRGDGLVLPALRAGQHDLRPQRQDLGGLRSPRPPLQLVPLGIGQDQPGLAPARTRAVSQPARAVPSEPPPPLAHRLNGKPQLSRHPGIPRGRVRARHNDPCALRHAPIPGTGQPFKLRAIPARQHQRRDSKRQDKSVQINDQNFRRMTLVRLLATRHVMAVYARLGGHPHGFLPNGQATLMTPRSPSGDPRPAAAEPGVRRQPWRSPAVVVGAVALLAVTVAATVSAASAHGSHGPGGTSTVSVSADSVRTVELQAVPGQLTIVGSATGRAGRSGEMDRSRS